MMTVTGALPVGFLETAPERIADLMHGPALIHLPGRRPRPLFVSVLLHGDEPTGLVAVQRLLRRYEERQLPRALSLFIGNVYAARKGVRFLAGQHDYNRIWGVGRDAEHEMTRAVLDEMRARHVAAAVDVHNNSGRNPHYAIVARKDAATLALASGFSRIVVYGRYPDTTCTFALSAHCPSMAIEAGQAHEARAAEQVTEFLDGTLKTESYEVDSAPEVDLYRSVAVVRVPRAVEFGWPGEEADLEFVAHLEEYNFRELAPGTVIARQRRCGAECLDVRDEHGHQVAARFFESRAGEIRLRVKTTPAMLTRRREAIRMDCLGYLMERLGG
jgi:succinylglutamate desuccinylase